MENVALIVANLFGGLLCVGIGFIIRTGKANFLIAGYNTMDAKEQERWNAKEMSAFLGKMMIASGVVLLLACPLILLRVAPTVTMMISWGLFMAGLIAGVIYMNVSPRFKVRGDER